MNARYKKGDILRGKINACEIEILAVKSRYYKYRDLKSGRAGEKDIKTLDRCLFERIGGVEQ